MITDYPAFETAQDIYNTGILGWLPDGVIERSQEISKQNPVLPYGKGALLAEMLTVGRVLSTFSSALPNMENIFQCTIMPPKDHICDGCFVEDQVKFAGMVHFFLFYVKN